MTSSDPSFLDEYEGVKVNTPDIDIDTVRNWGPALREYYYHETMANLEKLYQQHDIACMADPGGRAHWEYYQTIQQERALIGVIIAERVSR